MSLKEEVVTAVAGIPKWCKLDGQLGSHEWIVAYGDPSLEFLENNSRLKVGEQMLPYYICKHCYAVSNDRTTSPYVMRVR